MKKLQLILDELAVESFTTRGEARPHGTVRGNDATQGGAGCGTDNVGTWCCWEESDTTAQSPQGTVGGGGTGGPSHAISCGATCYKTGNWRCFENCDGPEL